MVEIPDRAWTEGPFSPLFHEAAELVGRRWTGAVLYGLAHGLHRFSELEDAIPGLSARLLTERLRELEAAGIVQRVAQANGSRRSYELTDKGDDLRPVLMALNRWAVAWSGSAADGGGAARPVEIGATGPSRLRRPRSGPGSSR